MMYARVGRLEPLDLGLLLSFHHLVALPVGRVCTLRRDIEYSALASVDYKLTPRTTLYA